MSAGFDDGRDHQHGKADDLVGAVRDLLGSARVIDVGGEAQRDAEAVLDFAQDEQTAIGAQMRGVEPGDDRLAADR